MNLFLKIWRNSFLIRYNIVLIVYYYSLTRKLKYLKITAVKYLAHDSGLKTNGCLIFFILESCVVRSETVSYSSLILNFLTLSPVKTRVMIARTNVSFHMYMNPVPFIIMFLIITMKYLGGKIELR